jgi:hypothetical protein
VVAAPVVQVTDRRVPRGAGRSALRVANDALRRDRALQKLARERRDGIPKNALNANRFALKTLDNTARVSD